MLKMNTYKNSLCNNRRDLDCLSFTILLPFDVTLCVCVYVCVCMYVCMCVCAYDIAASTTEL